MPDNIVVKDATGANVTLRTTETGGVHTPQHTPIVGGNPVSSANRMPVALPDNQTSASGAVLIGNSKNKIRDEFPSGGLDPAVWETIAVGAGMTVTTGNGTTGSYLRIQSGVTANSETILRTQEIVTLPVRLAAFVTASQRIANQELFVELIEVDSAGNPATVAAAQPNAGNWRNHASTKFDGTSATTALTTVRAGGAPEFVSAANTTQTTVATGADPNFFPVGYVEMQVSGEHVALLQGAIDTTGAATVARRVTQAAPDPSKFYKLQIRARNLGTAPASTTDWRVHAVRLFDYTRTTVEVIGGPGHGSGAMAVPAVVNGTVTANIGTGALAAGTNAIGDVGVQIRANNTGAASPFNYASPAAPAGGSVKSGAGRVTGINLTNNAASVRWVKFFNATAVTMGTTTAAFEFPIGPGQSINYSSAQGLGFATGIMIAVTAARGLTDNTATGLALGDVAGFLTFA
jgi:hypothetical protein